MHGIEGSLSVTNPDSAQRIEDYIDTANPFYLLVELILMVVRADKQQLSISHSNRELMQIAEFNDLTDVSIMLPNRPLMRIV